MKAITLITLTVSLLYVTVDFVSRFSSDNYQVTNLEPDFNNNSGISTPQLSAAQKLKLIKAYKIYQEDDEKIKVVKSVLGLTDEQKLAQEGELTEFYDGDLRYRLLAIIFPDGGEQALKSPIALLLTSNVNYTSANTNNNKKENEIKITRVGHGSKIGLFDASISNTKQVEFQLGQRKITLLMYQPTSKNAKQN